MAKEQWHNWGRTFIILAGIIFAGGGYAMKIHGNTTDISKVDDRVTNSTTAHGDDIKKVEDRVLATENDIHTLELDAKDIMNLAVTTAKTMQSIDTKLDSIQKEQAKLATVQAVMSVKLETLTKDE